MTLEKARRYIEAHFPGITVKARQDGYSFWLGDLRVARISGTGQRAPLRFKGAATSRQGDEFLAALDNGKRQLHSLFQTELLRLDPLSVEDPGAVQTNGTFGSTLASEVAGADQSLGESNQEIAADLPAPTGVARAEVLVRRIIRDTELARRVKALHSSRCQICGKQLPLGGGEFYAEGHHLQPLGAPHNGPDVAGNIVCVCPNHHALLDFGGIRLEFDCLRSVPGHLIEQRYLDYHNAHIWRADQ